MDFQNDVFELIRQVAYGYGVEKLAAKMGIQRGTLYNKLNNDDGSAHHKLTLQDFIQIITITGQYEPLLGLCGLFDHVAYKLPDLTNLADDALLDIINSVHISGGQTHQAMADALEDGRITPDEYTQFSNQVFAWLSAILAWQARVKGMVVITHGK